MERRSAVITLLLCLNIVIQAQQPFFGERKFISFDLQDTIIITTSTISGLDSIEVNGVWYSEFEGVSESDPIYAADSGQIVKFAELDTLAQSTYDSIAALRAGIGTSIPDTFYVAGQNEWIESGDTIKKVDSANVALNADSLGGVVSSGYMLTSVYDPNGIESNVFELQYYIGTGYGDINNILHLPVTESEQTFYVSTIFGDVDSISSEAAVGTEIKVIFQGQSGSEIIQGKNINFGLTITSGFYEILIKNEVTGWALLTSGESGTASDADSLGGHEPGYYLAKLDTGTIVPSVYSLDTTLTSANGYTDTQISGISQYDSAAVVFSGDSIQGLNSDTTYFLDIVEFERPARNKIAYITQETTKNVDFSLYAHYVYTTTATTTINFSNILIGTYCIIDIVNTNGTAVNVGTGWGTVKDNQPAISTTAGSTTTVQFINNGLKTTYMVLTEGN